MSHTALIVEDDPGTRHLLQETLTSAGIASLFAETGAAMWRQLEHGPDLIILDLSLPDASLPFSMEVHWLPGFLAGFLAHNGIFTINMLPLAWIALSLIQMRMQGGDRK